MKIKRWADKVMWFVLGAVAVGLLLASSTSSSKVEAAQDIQQLEQRVATLEEWVRARDAEKAEQIRSIQKEKPPPNYDNRRDPK